MNPDIESAWQTLDALAVGIGQEHADIVRRFLAENRALMLAYADVYRQLAEARMRGAPTPQKHRESTPVSDRERVAATG